MRQNLVAQIIGVSPSTILKFEQQKVPYEQDLVEAVADLFEIAPGDLLYRDPGQADPLAPILDKIRAAPPDVQKRIIAVAEALLKMG
jgi:transcriptional regulator with XRE-family HTH domain